jgi:hypothetical protein
MVIVGGQSGFDCTLGVAPDMRLFNNTFYTAQTQGAGIPFIKASGTASFRHYKAINNAIYTTQTDVDNDAFRGSGNFDYLGGVQILRNVWFQGGSTGDFGNIIGVNYANDAAWAAAALKGAQDNDEANPLFANAATKDFRLCTASGVPDASCTGASPCIDVGYDLPTVYYDFVGTVRNSDDIGAWDDDSAVAGGGAASGVLLGIYP